MRLAIAALLAFGMIAQAQATLSDDVRPPMQCSPVSCIDPQTGDYTQSVCDAAGCRQSGGVIGRPRPREKRRMLRQTTSGFKCNTSRCIERATGAIWKSTCDTAGCRPMR